MHHLVFFYYILSLLIGFSALVLSLLVYLKLRAKPIIYYFYFLCSLSLNVLLNTLLIYIDTNNVNIPNQHFFLVMEGIFILAVVSYLITIPLFFRSLIGKPLNRIEKALQWGAVLISVTGMVGIITFSEGIPQTLQRIQQGKWLLYAFLFIQILWNLFIIQREFRKISNPMIKRILKSLWILCLIFLPGLIMDAFWWKFLPLFTRLPRGFYFNPVFYSFWSGLSIYYAAYYLYWKPEQFRQFQRSVNYERFGLSEREQAMVNLLISGASNKEIAHELSLSLANVKFLLHGIYKKLKVQSRVECLKKLTNQS